MDSIRKIRLTWARWCIPAAITLAVLLMARSGAWAADGDGRLAQTIPTVTPAQATGTAVPLPTGLLVPATAAPAAPALPLEWSALPLGCLCLSGAVILLALAWLMGRRKKT